MREIKEKPVLPNKVKEKVKAAPKELARRGLSKGANRLRRQLRDAAQHGQTEDMGQDHLEDGVVQGIQHLEQSGKCLLQKAKKDVTKDRSKPERKAQTKSPTEKATETTTRSAPTVPEDARPRIKTREVSLQRQRQVEILSSPAEKPVQGNQPLIRERGREQTIKQTVQERHTGISSHTDGVISPKASASVSDVPFAPSTVPEGYPVRARERGKARTVRQAVQETRHIGSNFSGESAVHSTKSVSAPAMTWDGGAVRGVTKKEPPLRNFGAAGRTLGQDGRVTIKGTKQTVSASRVPAQTAQAAARKTHAVRQLTGQMGRSRQASKATGKGAKAVSQATGRTLRAMAQAAKGLLATLAGGGSLCAVLVMVLCVVGLLVASPFGILFAGESGSSDAVPVSAAVAQVNYDFNTRLEELQAGSYDNITIEGQPPEWADVLSVFAVYVAGGENAVDVAVMDADRVARLKAVFWDMAPLSSTTETVDHPDSDSDDDVDDSYTETNLTITIVAKTAEDMATIYGFTQEQTDTLRELLEQRDLLTELAGETASLSAQAREVLRALPDDLSTERKAVVQAACSLVGKVNYFWGGKSLVLGWDSRWGTLQKVWAEGSSTTGTYRPYGLDCSGFADWVFYNASGGDYILGHGGGASAQHSYCTPISWDEAIPGDLVFYPGDSHVGIVGGRDESGNLLVIHCASGYNNVVITGLEGFTAIGRPGYYHS